jgi:hypothetical protein
MIWLYSLFSSTMTAIRDAGPLTVPEVVATVDDDGLGAGAADDRVVAAPPPQPAIDPISSATVTIRVTR